MCYDCNYTLLGICTETMILFLQFCWLLLQSNVGCFVTLWVAYTRIDMPCSAIARKAVGVPGWNSNLTKPSTVNFLMQIPDPAFSCTVLEPILVASPADTTPYCSNWLSQPYSWEEDLLRQAILLSTESPCGHLFQNTNAGCILLMTGVTLEVFGMLSGLL
jgi:hypothetical protein